jgi:type VI secretion system protein ImpL
LLLGESAAGKTTALSHAHLDLPLTTPEPELPGTHAACQWWFFDQGIILDSAGEYALRLDGHTANDTGWKTFLRLLQTYRPERPLDGVILAIPYTDLREAQSASPQHLDNAARKAAILHRKLVQAQKTLGVCFPVYILITKCDHMPGFRSLCQALPMSWSHEMLGWSNPYALENAYTTHWVDDACQYIHEQLYQLQLEVFASREPSADHDALFRLPSAFQALQTPLRTYLDHLFRPSVYHESFFFRGLYLCGVVDSEHTTQPLVHHEIAEAVDATETIPPDTTGITAGQTFFLPHLLAHKIFPEHGLARPATRAFLSRNRLVLATQVALLLLTLIGGFGIWRASGHLAESKRTLLPVLTDVANDLDELQGLHTVDHNAFDDNAVHVLQGMTHIHTSDLHSAFMPASWSWFSTLHTDIVQAMTIVYDRIIMTTLFTELDRRAQTVISRHDLSPPAPSPQPDLHLEETPEFLTLQAYLAQLAELQHMIGLYNDLQAVGASDVRNLGQVVQYAYGIELPEGFYANARSYQAALAQASGHLIDPQIYADTAKVQTKRLLQDVYARLFTSNDLFKAVYRLTDLLAHLTVDDPVDTQLATLRTLLETITQTETLLARPDFAWLSGTRLDLGTAFEQLFTLMADSIFLGVDFRQQVERDWAGAFQRLKETFVAATAAPSGPLLQWNESEERLQLAAGVQTIKGALETFFTLPYIVREPQNSQRSSRAAYRRVRWDSRVLDEAVRLYEPYEQFRHQVLTTVPIDIGDILEIVALSRLGLNMQDLIAQAQQTLPPLERVAGGHQIEDGLQAEIDNFSSVTLPLSQLIDTLNRLGLIDVSWDLAAQVNSQAFALLSTVDHLLLEDELYATRSGDFNGWYGDGSPALVAFAVQDAKEMTYYLGLQRDRVAHLARHYAAPLLTFLTPRSTQRSQEQERLLARWETILVELDKYDKKKPDNTIAVLESFILNDLKDLDANNCLVKLPVREKTEPLSDFFLQQRNRLQGALTQRCQTLASINAFASYTQIADAFNSTLAGKFPFANSGSKDGDTEADPEAIRAFYRLFDPDAKQTIELLQVSTQFGQVKAQALAFLEQMQVVRTFFAPFLQHQDVELPAFDIQADFRANRSHEIGGQQIIDWRLDIGQQAFQYHESNRLGRWQFGDPVRFSLRWAKDAPSGPLASGQQPWIDSENRRAVYTYPNHWALLSFLRQHAANPGDFDRFADPKPHTLKFIVPTTATDATPRLEGPEAATQVTVFMRLQLLSADKKSAMTLPRFPIRAPLLATAAQYAAPRQLAQSPQGWPIAMP